MSNFTLGYSCKKGIESCPHINKAFCEVCIADNCRYCKHSDWGGINGICVLHRHEVGSYDTCDDYKYSGEKVHQRYGYKYKDTVNEVKE